MAGDVFISYSSKDKATAEAACSALEARGIRCWIAPRDVLPGTDYAAAIVEAITQCRALVLIFSAHANASRHVAREVGRAMSKSKIVIPFRIDSDTPSGTLEYYLGDTQWLDATAPPLEARIDELAAGIQRVPEQPAKSQMSDEDSPEDYGLAQFVCDFLESKAVETGRGRPFFGALTMRTPRFKRDLDEALGSANCLVAVATKPEHLSNEYPQPAAETAARRRAERILLSIPYEVFICSASHEWTSFHTAMLAGRKAENVQMLLYTDGDPKALPHALETHEVIRHNPENPSASLEELYRIVERSLASGNEQDAG